MSYWIDKLKKFVLKHPGLLPAVYMVTRWIGPFFRAPLAAVWGYIWFFRDFQNYKQLGGGVKISEAYPCLFDRTATTGVDPQYFHQMIWAGQKIYKSSPETHVDVGSDVKFVGMLTLFAKVIFVDIRPLVVTVEGMICQEGSILALPFEDDSISSISSLHVIEHIGLGRYGDPLDPAGAEKACKELMRVLAPGGGLYVSVPVGRARIQFNGQRVFAVQEFLEQFPSLDLIDIAVVDSNGKYHPDISPAEASEISLISGKLDYSLGCFVFRKLSV